MTRRTDFAAVNALALDHYPTCPRCGNLCGRLARVCFDCGAHLYDDVTNDGRRRLRSAEDSHPNRETEV